jgi:hypothetical protein
VSQRQLAVQACDGQVDQEFLRLPNGSGNTAIQELAYDDGRLCVSAARPAPGTPVRLAPCGSGPALSWIPMLAWSQWGGGRAALIHGYSATGTPPVQAMGTAAGTVAPVVTEPFASGDTAQAWLSGPFGLRPVANAGWCRFVPSLTAGTALTVQPCGSCRHQSRPLPGSGHQHRHRPGTGHPAGLLTERYHPVVAGLLSLRPTCRGRHPMPMITLRHP